MSAVTDRIKAGMTANSLSANSIAKALGVSHQSISTIVRGVRPGRTLMPKIAEMLHCSLEWLANGTGPAPSWAPPSTPAVAPHLLITEEALRDIIKSAIREMKQALADHQEILDALQKSSRRVDRAIADGALEDAINDAVRGAVRAELRQQWERSSGITANTEDDDLTSLGPSESIRNLFRPTHYPSKERP